MSISDAWNAAAIDLGIRVTAPAIFEFDERMAEFDAHIENFGSPAGTVIAPLHETDPAMREVALEAGAFLSHLAPIYAEYDRLLFIETLNDWGWFGTEGTEPPWFRKVPW